MRFITFRLNQLMHPVKGIPGAEIPENDPQSRGAKGCTHINTYQTTGASLLTPQPRHSPPPVRTTMREMALVRTAPW